MTTQNLKLYQCKECSLWYAEKEWMEKCEVWCREHKSCNLEIIAHAVDKDVNTEAVKGGNESRDNTFFKIGVVAAFLASLCCIGPLILIALGVGTAASVLSIGYNKSYFLIGALFFFVVVAILYIRKKNRTVCDCGDGTQKLDKQKIAVQIVIALCAMVTIYLLLTFVLVPYLVPLVYKYLY